MGDIGNITCDSKSTIDNVICTPDLLPNITDFTVHDFCPLLSDKHRPISVSLDLTSTLSDTNTYTTHTNDTHNANTHYTKCKWDNSKKGEYMQNFDTSKINNISNNLSAINMSKILLPIIDSFAQELKDLFTDPAK